MKSRLQRPLRFADGSSSYDGKKGDFMISRDIINAGVAQWRLLVQACFYFARRFLQLDWSSLLKVEKRFVRIKFKGCNFHTCILHFAPIRIEWGTAHRNVLWCLEMFSWWKYGDLKTLHFLILKKPSATSFPLTWAVGIRRVAVISANAASANP